MAQCITNHENIPPSKTYDLFLSQRGQCSQRLSVTTNRLHNEDTKTQYYCGLRNQEATEMKRADSINTRMPHNFRFEDSLLWFDKYNP